MAGNTKRSSKTHGEQLLSRAGRKVAGLLVGWRCPVCGSRIDLSACKRSQLSVDHIDACSLGGSDRALLPLCGACNSSKRAEVLEAWLPGRLRATKRARSQAAATALALELAAELRAIPARLESALISAGIWS